MSTFEIKRQGRTVAKFRAPHIQRQGVNRFVWTMYDSDGTTLIGTIYLTTDKLLTVEEVTHGQDAATGPEGQGLLSPQAPLPGDEKSGE